MKRTSSSWSNATDIVEGPCVVCQQPVKFVLPFDRKDPAFLAHPTCDVMPLLREKLKSVNPPVLPGEFTLRFRDSKA